MSAQRKFSFEPTNFPHQNFAPHDTEEEYRDTPRYLYSDTFIPSSSITEQQLTKMKTSPFYEYFQQLAGKEAQKLQVCEILDRFQTIAKLGIYHVPILGNVVRA